MNFLSLCSGIEAASVAFGPLGWKAVGFSEIEPAPCAVLAHHYPNVPNFGDMNYFEDWPIEMFASVDIIVGGPPCQAFSIAGQRNSLDDARGNLTLTYVRLLDHADKIRRERGLSPVIALYENVPGLLSTKDNAFGCLVGAIAGQDGPVETETGKWPTTCILWGKKRRVGYRVLDAQFFGLAQRRRRIFLIAMPNELVERFGDGADPAALLSIPESLLGNPAPRREAREDIAGGFEIGPSSSRLTDVAPTLDCRAKNGPIQNQLGAGVIWPAEVAPTLNAAFGSKLGLENQHIRGGRVIHPCDSPAALTTKTRIDAETETLIPTIGGLFVDTPATTVPFAHVETMPTLRAGAPTGGPGHGARSGDSKDEYIVSVYITGDITHTLKAEGFDASEDGTGRGQPIVAAYGISNQPTPKFAYELSPPLDAKTSGGGRMEAVCTGMAVRRLTPKECARLQGFPDDYLSQVIVRNKPVADGPMYKALGNSWAVPNVAWIGRRIDAALRRQEAP